MINWKRAAGTTELAEKRTIAGINLALLGALPLVKGGQITPCFMRELCLLHYNIRRAK